MKKILLSLALIAASLTSVGANATTYIMRAISKGLAVTPASSSNGDYFQDVTLLMHMDDLTDVTSKNTLSTVGSPQISTSTVKFGTGALYLNGSSALQESNNPNFSFGTQDFTVEFWLYSPIAWTSQPYATGVIGQKLSDTTNGWVIYRDGGYPAQMNFRIPGLDCETTSTPATGAWEFWAVTRQGTTVRWFKNGVLDATCTASSVSDVTDTSGTFYIGYSQTWGGYGNIYMDDLRITKGYARYTANFTPPTAPFPNN